MHSSTSNFKGAFIGAGILLLIYTLSLHFIHFPLETGQSQFQENKIKLENFIFEQKPCDKIIVGSSLAFRLRQEDFNSDFCNLAFAGSSALTGLEILLHRPPTNLKTVIVEMNVLRPLDVDLLGSSSGVSYWLKRNFLFFQNRYQPITVLVNYLRYKNPTIQPAPTESQFQFWLKEQQKDYSEVSDLYLRAYESNLLKLKGQIDLLAAKGIKIIFVEIPMDPSILSSPKQAFHRKRFTETFPEEKLLIDPANYPTDDGLHLRYESAQKFTAFVKSIAQ